MRLLEALGTLGWSKTVVSEIPFYESLHILYKDW